MKQLITLIIFSASILSAYSQSRILDLTFSPSFLSPCRLQIEEVDSMVNVLFTTHSDTIQFVPTFEETTSILNTFEEYEFNIDKLQTIASNKDTTILGYIGFDGITIHGQFTSKITKSFRLWSPKINHPGHSLTEQILDLLFKYCSDQSTINYLELLEGYFDFGLGIKAINNFPKTFKLYGSITSNDEMELREFLKSLTETDSIIIDLSNLTGMGTMFYPIINELVKNKSNIYWSTGENKYVLVHLYKIGIEKKYIISDYELKKLKEGEYSKKVKIKRKNSNKDHK